MIFEQTLLDRYQHRYIFVQSYYFCDWGLAAYSENECGSGGPGPLFIARFRRNGCGINEAKEIYNALPTWLKAQA